MRVMTIGFAEHCDVVVAGDPYMSAVHAEVGVDDDGCVWVRDAGSLNGTWIQRAGRPTPDHPARLPRVQGWERFRPGDTLWLTKSTAIPWDDAHPER